VVGHEFRYKAFLSYSHKDAAVAGWLHRRLETYRIPRRLVGREGDPGPVPARLTPIFRDREELPAAGDLSAQVRAALAASESLIVICSPASAASPWVAKEIALFHQLHPDRPVFAAIVEGDPAQCFPCALTERGAEPLAADIRAEGDGRRLGFLKLVAGLSGVGLDALVQRDAQRRIRRVTTVTAGALAAMLIMAVLTGFALTARQEAERQRAEAEGLVEFMLTDLRRELRKVGRLDIMGTVNERVLVYYGNRSGSAEPGARLALRARVDHVRGEDLLARGQTDAAGRLFRQAHRLTSPVVQQRPDDPAAVFAHAQSEYWIGRLHELRAEWSLAERRYASFTALAERLITLAPQNPEYISQVAWAALDLGNVQLNGSTDAYAAQRSYQKAIEWFGRASEAHPRDSSIKLAQANAYGWLADSYSLQEAWPQALEARVRQHALVQRLQQQDPDNLEFGYRLALAQRGLAGSYTKVGRRDLAGPLRLSTYAAANRLTSHDPSNAEWLLYRAFVGCDLFFGSVELPPGASRDQLANDIRGIARTLRAQGNPRTSEFKNCEKAIINSGNGRRG
jgi:tetratricopeptide (TPR) repeat protein